MNKKKLFIEDINVSCKIHELYGMLSGQEKCIEWAKKNTKIGWKSLSDEAVLKAKKFIEDNFQLVEQ